MTLPNAKPVPFDAHEQVVRQPHTHSRVGGYQAVPYEEQEFPKHEQVENEDGSTETVVNRGTYADLAKISGARSK